MDDHLIIKLLFERSEQAISEITNKYGKLCQDLSYQIVKNSTDAEECVNDALLAVWNSVPPNNPNSLSAYLCKITRNLSLKKYRSNTAKKRNSFYNTSLEELYECITDTSTIENQIDADTLRTLINEFLCVTKPIDRLIFIKRFWFCYDISKIAKDINKSENYVNVHLHRTKARLKDYLSKEEFL